MIYIYLYINIYTYIYIYMILFAKSMMKFEEETNIFVPSNEEFVKNNVG